MGLETFKRVLVLDDDASVQRALGRLVRAAGGEAILASSLMQAAEAIGEGVDLAIIDVFLGEESGVDAVHLARKHETRPLVVAISGYAGPTEGIELGKAGVDAFIPKPVSRKSLESAIDGATTRASSPESDTFVRNQLGSAPLPDVIRGLRLQMVHHALDATSGNKSAAARMLGISRQHLQLLLKREHEGCTDEEEE